MKCSKFRNVILNDDNGNENNENGNFLTDCILPQNNIKSSHEIIPCQENNIINEGGDI